MRKAKTSAKAITWEWPLRWAGIEARRTRAGILSPNGGLVCAAVKVGIGSKALTLPLSANDRRDGGNEGQES